MGFFSNSKDNKAALGFKPPKSNLKLSAVAIEKNILFSKSDAYAVYVIPNQSYEFLSSGARIRIADDYNKMLENLVKETPVNCHQIVTSKPFDVYEWGQSLYKKVQNWNPQPYFGRHLWDMMQHVEARNFSIKETFLLIHLGRRNKNYLSDASTKGALGIALKMIDKVALVNDQLVSQEERLYWIHKEKDYGHTVTSSNTRGIRANSAEIAWLIKKNLFPGYTIPETSATDHEPWGAGEIQLLGLGQVSRKTRHLEITQFDPATGQEFTGYRATLSFARFPEVMDFPENDPWIHTSASFPFNVDVHSRFTLEPAQKVRKEIGNKGKEIKDQIVNAQQSSQSVPIAIQEQAGQVEALEYELSKNRNPWVYARHRIVIEAPTLDELRENAQYAIEQYKSNHSITVVWTSADQMELFLETMPGDKTRDTAFLQRHKLDVMGGGMPHGSGTVGDTVAMRNGRKQGWIGTYLGYTTSRVEEPVFLSVHSAIAHNNAPGLAITGAPGGGKSFSAFTMTYHMALEGVWTIYLDPKADAKPMKNLPGLETAQVFDLRENGNDGMLDPFSIGESIPERQLLALETVRLLTGELPNDQESELIEAIKFVVLEDDPSLNRIVDYLLKKNDEKAAKVLGQKLSLIRDLPFARLCFSSKKVNYIRPDKGLTLITLLGLSLPSSEDKQENYSYDNRLAVGVMYLLTSFTRKLMLSLNKKQPKAIIIDEAWAITSTPQGAKIVPEVARMGRSHNTALILVSQNAGDLLSEGITNSISIKMAYRANVVTEVESIIKFFDLDEKDQGLLYTIQRLENGECLIRDAEKRTARVQVDAWNDEMRRAFDANPDTREDKNSGVPGAE